MKIKYPSQKNLKEIFDLTEDNVLIWKKKIANSVVIGSVSGWIDKSIGYHQIRIYNKNYYTHRLMWIWHKGFNPENNIDHIDQNKLNNRIENLREVTQVCNMRNRGNPITNTSSVKGVGWNKDSNKWYGLIQSKYIKRYLGLYDDFGEAVLARLAAEQCLDWSGCDSSSPAYKYAIENNLIRK